MEGSGGEDAGSGFGAGAEPGLSGVLLSDMAWRLLVGVVRAVGGTGEWSIGASGGGTCPWAEVSCVLFFLPSV